MDKRKQTKSNNIMNAQCDYIGPYQWCFKFKIIFERSHNEIFPIAHFLVLQMSFIVDLPRAAFQQLSFRSRLERRHLSVSEITFSMIMMKSHENSACWEIVGGKCRVLVIGIAIEMEKCRSAFFSCEIGF